MRTRLTNRFKCWLGRNFLKEDLGLIKIEPVDGEINTAPYSGAKYYGKGYWMPLNR